MNLPEITPSLYLQAYPFPYLVVDNVFDPSFLQHIVRSWPQSHERYTNNKFELSKGSTISESNMGDDIPDFIHSAFQSQRFIMWLESVTDIKGLVFDCRKFGLHETFPGGSLMPHLDYTISQSTGLELRLNVILFLNENWDSTYGGYLDLYSKRPKDNEADKSISPLFNRLVIFQAKDAWHGHRTPLNCPQNMTRKSIALNYFTLPRDGATAKRTIFSNEKKSILKSCWNLLRKL